MKRQFVPFVSVLIVVYAEPARAVDGLYFGFGGSWSTPNDIKWHDSSVSPTRGKIALKDGGAADAEFGYRLRDDLRIGLEFGNAIYGVATVSANGTTYSSNGQVTQTPGLGNVAYEIESI